MRASHFLSIAYLFVCVACAPVGERTEPDNTPTPRVAAPISEWQVDMNQNEEKLTFVKDKYSYIDKKNVIPDEALLQALTFFDANLAKIKNQKFLTVLDFSVHSKNARLHIIDMATGDVESVHTSHGKNSDPEDTGFATLFSNTVDSLQSSLGFYYIAETYNGTHGFSVRMDGLSQSNSKVRERFIVMHPADYVKDGLTKMGRSWGCPAIDKTISKRIIKNLSQGSLMLAWIPGYK